VPVFEVFWTSIKFDIVRYVLIFLMIFGHNLGTNDG
jgi:fucose 4-O-acetylase-like acetyltransferase